MYNVVLRNMQAPGDVLILSACIRDIHRCYPGMWNLRALTPRPDIWFNNPDVIHGPYPSKNTVDIGYTRGLQHANDNVGHFISGMMYDCSVKLHHPFYPTELRPAVYLTDEEKDPANNPVPPGYWIMMAGGKADFPTKVWDPAYFTEVAARLGKDIRIVQMGASGGIHSNPNIPGTHSMVGKTTLRQFLQMVYHSDGVICPVTAAMHAAAAFNKPCVVLAGGREPWWWEAYTRNNWNANCTLPCPDDFVSHRFLHNLGQLPCSQHGGCWAQGITEKKVRMCKAVVGGPTRPQPRCMTMITPDMVVGAVHDYLAGKPVIEDEIPSYLAPCILKSSRMPAYPRASPPARADLEREERVRRERIRRELTAFKQ
jgi:hypothetical protein